MNCQSTSDTTGWRFARNWWRADTEAGRAQTPVGYSHGVGPLYPASHRTSRTRAMGAPLSSEELRIPPAALGASGRAAIAGGHPRRPPVGGGPRSGSVL